MSTRHDEDATSVVPMDVDFLLLLIRGVPRSLAGVDGLLRYQGCTCRRPLLSGLEYPGTNLVHLLLGDEIGGIVGDGSVAG